MNITAFARALGVSTATVSRAFSGKGRISDATRRRILREAEKRGYSANVFARGLSTRRSNTVGFFYPTVGSREPDYFVSEIMLGVSEKAAALGKLVRIHPIGDGENNVASSRNHLLDGGLEGVVVVAGPRASESLVRTAAERGVAYMVIGRTPGERKRVVALNATEGARQAGRYFVNTARSRAAYVGGVLDRGKRKGFLSGLGPLAADVAFDDGGTSFAHGERAFGRLRQLNPPVDCVFCANDVLAIGLLKAANDAGMRVPEDMAVIGCDDIRVARYVTPALTTIALRGYEAGALAMERINALINGAEKIEAESVEADLVIRESA